jgi:tRNA G18 (ribose-2'-O)-methylase SpoU
MRFFALREAADPRPSSLHGAFLPPSITLQPVIYSNGKASVKQRTGDFQFVPMAQISISSLDDPRLAVYRQLKRSNLTRWSGLFIAEGDKVVRRLLASRIEVVSVLAAERCLLEFAPLVPPHVPLYVLPDRLLPEVVGFNFHRGILACGRRPADACWQHLFAEAASRRTLLVLPAIQGPENLGLLLRTGAALGIDAILLGPQSADPWSRRVLRVSMGLALHVPLRQARDVRSELQELAERWGVRLIAAVPRTGTPLMQARQYPRLALLFGNEGEGLEPDLLARCHEQVAIPMPSGADSLNVAVAAGIIMHHYLHGPVLPG